LLSTTLMPWLLAGGRRDETDADSCLALGSVTCRQPAMTRTRSEHVSLPRSRRQHYQHHSPPCGPDLSRPYRHIWAASKVAEASLPTGIARTFTARPGRATPPETPRHTYPAGYGRPGLRGVGIVVAFASSLSLNVRAMLTPGTQGGMYVIGRPDGEETGRCRTGGGLVHCCCCRVDTRCCLRAVASVRIPGQDHDRSPPRAEPGQAVLLDKGSQNVAVRIPIGEPSPLGRRRYFGAPVTRVPAPIAADASVKTGWVTGFVLLLWSG
jgi:hypothetical protein